MNRERKRGPGAAPRAKDTLRNLDVRPSKERGQNFLIRPEVPEAIVAFAAAQKDAHIVEIGPGTGALTQLLAGARKLTLIEIEAKFCEYLRGKYPQATVINHDARSFDFSSIGSELFVFGNIPYVFSTEIVFQLLKYRSVVRHAVLMVQREFAERVAAAPGGRDYGSLSVAVQVFADVELGPIVPGDSFHPPTAVQSRVMKLSFLKSPRVELDDPTYFETVVRGAFSQRRKKVVNSLLSCGRWTKDDILTALNSAAVSPDVRAEQIDIASFALLAKYLRQQQYVNEHQV
ncbi:MAG: 16S rRNA (adenine(1518)-N(6)/adenine(1519)-N(6))-dimethyltransferase RsmA [Pseudomonadota bacterium]